MLGYRIVYAILWPIMRLIYPCRYVGQERLPEGAVLICANHSNAIDPLLIAFAFGRKRQIHFMAKEELSHVPLIGWVLKQVGAFFVKRGESDIGAMRTAIKYLKDGERVMMFPEGTRVSEDDAVAAKTGAIRLASKLGVPILPIHIPRKKKRFRRLDIVIGESYLLPKLGHSEYEEKANELMQRIHTLAEVSA